jgi:pimeloyl-ACP methyl ester carboxylesterase
VSNYGLSDDRAIAHTVVDVRDVDAALLILIPDDIAQIRLRRTGRTEQSREDPTNQSCRNRKSLHDDFPYLAESISPALHDTNNAAHPPLTASGSQAKPLTIRLPSIGGCAPLDRFAAAEGRDGTMTGMSRCFRVRRIGRLVQAILLATAFATTVTGCDAPIGGKPELSGAPLPPAAPVQWGPCQIVGGGNGAQLPAGAQCGELTVPVDYSNSDPDGAVAQLTLIRFPATGQKIGSLVVNPGGPGASGVDAAASMVNSLPTEIRQRFDFVGFDPRGVGSSTPELRCNSDADDDALRADPQVDYSPAGVAHIESTEKQYVQRCVDKMGKDFLANVGTTNVARDLDRLREALGDAKLTYLGYSYGTEIGSAYAEAYPDKVRAMILDGAIDPSADPIQASIDQSASFQKAFNDYAADCAENPSCPLGTDPAKAVDVYLHLVEPLAKKPAPTSDPRGLGYSDAITGTVMALYSPDMWSDLTDGLTELATGHGDTLLAMADSYLGRDQQGHYDNSNDAETAINCVDEPPVTDRAKAIDEDRRSRQVAPFMSYGQFTGDAPLDTCAFWPVPPTSGPHVVSAPGLPPVLVVSTTHDPATPYAAGVALAKQLGGEVLTFNGTQHTVVFEGNKCIDNYATAYLVDLKLPPTDSKC